MMTPLEITFALASHLIVADGEINVREIKVLEDLVPEINENMREEQSHIFSDDEQRIPLSNLLFEAELLGTEEKRFVVRVLLAVAYADSYYDKEESLFIDNICNKLRIDNSWFDIEKKNARFKSGEKLSYKSWHSRLNSKYAAYVNAKNNATNNKEVLDFGKDTFLIDAALTEKIKEIAEIAVTDLSIANENMKEYNELFLSCKNDISKNVKSIIEKNRKDGSTKELVDAVKTFEKEISNNMEKNLEDNIEILNKKRRTINYLTISFMGRTKAGKSTFHKVLTKEKRDDIGIGKQRTTRYNRSWESRNLRIVDTPGIGAADEGGRKDEEIAKSIIDQSDIVCYVVTNDSIQQTEFDFLKGLKDKNKPLFIILNVKSNIENSVRLKRFLNDPLAWKTTTGKDSLEGHFNRIKEVMGQSYDFNFVKIIPIQLLAAKMCYDENLRINDEPLSKEQKDKLYEGSNFSEYIREINESIYNGGFLKKTLNVIDGCNTQIYSIDKRLIDTKRQLESQYNSVEKHKQKIINDIKFKAKQLWTDIEREIETTFIELQREVKSFAEEHVEDKDKDLNDLWKDIVDKRIKQSNDNIQDRIQKLINEIREQVEDIMKDINFYLEQYEMNTSISGSSIFDFKNLFEGAGIAGGLLIGAITLFSGPIGWIPTAAVAAASIISCFLDSKEEKLAKAVAKIEKKLNEGLNESHKKYKKNTLDNYDKGINELSQTVASNFDLIIDYSKSIITSIDILLAKADTIQKEFNKVVVYRLLQQTKNLPIKKEIDYKILECINVNRDYEKKIIEFTSPVKLEDSFNKLATELVQQTIKAN